jgi:predicted nucleic acid-binding protein
VYLWDANILRHFEEGHPTLRLYLSRIPWSEIALPSVVVAELLRGRSDFALKASPTQAPLAHELLQKTRLMLAEFNVVLFDQASAEVMMRLQRQVKTNKRYADVMIAAAAVSGQHIVVTRNQRHFADLLPSKQLVNWIDVTPR